jgi:Ca2+:H+ antiporter
VFVFVQTIRHRDYFLDEEDDETDVPDRPHPAPSATVTAAAGVLLLLSLSAVVLLAKVLSLPIDAAVRTAGLPQAVVGIIIAAVVLLPEGVASVKSALANRLQNSINLALGSAVASIGLTIPTVAMLALLLDLTPALGLSPQNMTLLLLTLFVSTQTFSTGRTSVLQGAVHLVVFAVFLLISAVP